MGDQSVARPLPTQDNTKREKRTQISTAWAGCEPTITEFERAKTFHSLDRAAIVIDISTLISFLNKEVYLMRSLCSVCVCVSHYFNFWIIWPVNLVTRTPPTRGSMIKLTGLKSKIFWCMNIIVQVAMVCKHRIFRDNRLKSACMKYWVFFSGGEDLDWSSGLWHRVVW
jgi:hypothetical protein